MPDVLHVTRRKALQALLAPVAGTSLAALTCETAARPVYAVRPLVACLSRTGNTRVVAGQLQRAFQARLFDIQTAVPYPEDYRETVELARRQRDAAARPRLAEGVPEMASYDVVFLGFPIWGMALPAPVRTFLATHDLSGKTLVPFVTHGGYGTGSALPTLAALAPRARMLEPLVMKADQERDTLDRVSAWAGIVGPAL